MNSLFEKTSIGNLALKNRFVRSATGEAMATAEGGVTPKLIETYVKLVEGEVGLIISGHANVAKRGWGVPGLLGLHDNRLLPGLKELTDAVHEAGGKIIAQLAHSGARAMPGLWGLEAFGPSPVRVEGEPGGREMTPTEIEETVGAFADAAYRAKEAGFDGVQIHAAHGYLLSQFLSQFYNHRKDRYGGALENRARMVMEVFQAIRDMVGRDFPVIVKINSDDFMDSGFSVDEMLRVCGMLETAGIDGIELSGGTMDPRARFTAAREGKKSPEAWYREAAVLLKLRISIPLILVGGIRTLATARELVERGICDHISMSRPLIRQPDLVRLWRKGETDKASCVSCNKCFEPLMDGTGIRCMLDEKKHAKDSPVP